MSDPSKDDLKHKAGATEQFIKEVTYWSQLSEISLRFIILTSVDEREHGKVCLPTVHLSCNDSADRLKADVK